ncbi:MAG TPA: ABC transporter permease subunit [Candidatus Limnocylindria bacterium]|nr:ABC transporter permease subunit [Candidatus Limnocylindria bacterium]
MNTIQAIAIVVLKEMIRRKDFYVLFVITALITLLMGSINIFNDQSIAGYLKELALLLIWVSSLVMAITTTARQLHAEKENRTIFPLLAKPVSRAQLLIGKFFGCWIACGLALFVFYLFLGLVAASREHTLEIGSYVVAMLLHWGALAVVIGMALLGSIIFAAPSSNGTICFVVAVAILTLERHLNTVALHTGGIVGTITYAIYYITPRLDWAFDVREFLVFHNPMPVFAVWFQAILFYGAYTAVLLLVAWLLFRRRALNT